MLRAPAAVEIVELDIARLIRTMHRMERYVGLRYPNYSELRRFYRVQSEKELDDNEIFSQICWVIYSSGFRYEIVERFWPALTRAFSDFDVEMVGRSSERLQHSARQVCTESGFRNLSKAKWCILNAARIVNLNRLGIHPTGLKGFFFDLSKKGPYELIEASPNLILQLGFIGIGPATIFHLLKNLGVDIFKPDIHVCRLLLSLGLIAPNASIKEICDAMMLLTSLIGMRLSEVDTLLFFYGQAVGDSLKELDSFR